MQCKLNLKRPVQNILQKLCMNSFKRTAFQWLTVNFRIGFNLLNLQMDTVKTVY